MSISGDGPENYELEAEIERMSYTPRPIPDRLKSWVTRDGRVVRIVEMTDSHIVNTIAFLRRNVDSYRMKAMAQMWRYSETAPDGASRAADSAADAMDEAETDAVLEDCIPQFVGLRREAKRRKLWTEVED